MKYDPIYKETLGCATPEEVFRYQMSNFVESITRLRPRNRGRIRKQWQEKSQRNPHGNYCG